MDKNTKMILGIGLLGVVGYMIWKQQSKPKAFSNLIAPEAGCPCQVVDSTWVDENGNCYNKCKLGHSCRAKCGGATS